MESRAKLLGHPIHPMLIPLPLGLLSGSVAFDVVHRVTGDDTWGTVAAATIGAGIIGGLFAAPFGVANWAAIPDGTRAKRIGSLHGLGNVAVPEQAGGCATSNRGRRRRCHLDSRWREWH